MGTSSTRSRRILTKWEWALLVVPLTVLCGSGFLAWRHSFATQQLTTRETEFTALGFSPNGEFLWGVAQTFTAANSAAELHDASCEVLLWNVAEKRIWKRNTVQDIAAPALVSSDYRSLYFPNSSTIWNLGDNSMKQIATPRALREDVVDGHDEATPLVVLDYVNVVNKQSSRSVLRLSPPRKDAKSVEQRAHFKSRGDLFVRLQINRPKYDVLFIDLWNFNNGKRLASYTRPWNWSTVDISSNEKYMVGTTLKLSKAALNGHQTTISNNVDISLADTHSGRTLFTLKNVAAARHNRFSPDSAKLVSGGAIWINGATSKTSTGRSYFQLVDVATSKKLWSHQLQNCDLADIRFSPDGRFIAIANAMHETSAGIIKLWSVQSGACVATLRPIISKNSILDFTPYSFSPDSRTLAYGNGDSIKFVDVSNLR